MVRVKMNEWKNDKNFYSLRVGLEVDLLMSK
ncbi:hypothetical protein DP17_59 [Staphylococcus epidermidis]|nr:hypothetical protein DP17_59 [Staphylococcus epidermidis]